jgi:hypothetical protein
MCAVQRPDQRKKPSLLPWEDRRLTMSRMWSLRQYTLALSCMRFVMVIVLRAPPVDPEMGSSATESAER